MIDEKAWRRCVAAMICSGYMNMGHNQAMSTKKIRAMVCSRVSSKPLQILFAALAFSSMSGSGTAMARSDAPNQNFSGRLPQKLPTLGPSKGKSSLYPTIASYVDNTFKELPAGYTCVMAPNNHEVHDCGSGYALNDTDISRTFGIFYTASALSESGFLFIIKKHNEMFSVRESRPFQINARSMRYGWAIEAFVADSNDRFHFQTTSGSASMPDSDVFRFEMHDGQWVLSGHDHSTLSRCSDGSIDSGNSYSINFLTKKALIIFRDECKYVKTVERRLPVPPIPWTSFNPSDPDLDPKTYGVAWF
ncbi:MAG TPA: hypothetical protein VMV87_07935 [Burkholderiales bacterium]|nr:hypothetical protein [Burkholderiales bacterium]